MKERLAVNAPPSNLILTTRQPMVHPELIAWVWQQAVRCPALMAWVNRRENHYYVGPGQGWPFEAICYAACRDAACWLTKKKEKELLLPGGLVTASV